MRHPVWTVKEATSVEHAAAQVGLVPMFLDENDPRPAQEQINANYISGWFSQSGFKLVNKETATISYPGDTPMSPIAWTTLRDEKLYLYPGAWIMILQPDGSFDVSRID